jgi:hypothetical protein
VVAKYAADWPGWGHRKIWGLMRADGHAASTSTVQRAMRRRGFYFFNDTARPGNAARSSEVRSGSFACAICHRYT